MIWIKWQFVKWFAALVHQPYNIKLTVDLTETYLSPNVSSMKKVIFSSSWNIIVVLGQVIRNNQKYLHTFQPLNELSPSDTMTKCIASEVLICYSCVFICLWIRNLLLFISYMWRKSGNMLLFSCNEIMAQRVALYIDTRRHDTTSRLLSWEENSNYCKLDLNYRTALSF